MEDLIVSMRREYPAVVFGAYIANAAPSRRSLTGGWHLGADDGNKTPEGVVTGPLPQTPDLYGFSGYYQLMTDKKECSPGRPRTSDIRMSSRASDLVFNVPPTVILNTRLAASVALR